MTMQRNENTTTLILMALCLLFATAVPVFVLAQS
jgi:hypothetical protein